LACLGTAGLAPGAAPVDFPDKPTVQITVTVILYIIHI
jgi:hypothetical protein